MAVEDMTERTQHRPLIGMTVGAVLEYTGLPYFGLNGQYVAQMSLDRFIELARPFLEKAKINISDEKYLRDVLAIVKEKIKLFKDVPEWTSYFFTEDYEFDSEAVKKVFGKPEAAAHLQALRDEFVKIGFADEELVFCSFNRNRNQPGFDFGRCPNGIGHIDSGPPREVLDSRRRLGPEVLCSELSEGFLHPQVEWIGLRQEVGRQCQRVRRGIQPLLGLLLDQLSFFLQKIDRQ